ncbi:MAG: TolC family protein [Gammaproteobacteria bacterium]|nr:TolC family protein [Gammaproteobacteria bacterium]
MPQLPVMLRPDLAIFLGLATAVLPGVASGAGDAEVPQVTLAQAVTATIEHNYAIRLERIGTESGEGLLESASGEFDWNLITDASAFRERLPPLLPWDYGTDISDWMYSAGFRKKFRSGVEVSPNAGVDVLKDPDVTSRRWISRGSVRFEMLIPLARGGGEASAAAAELFARRDLAARYALFRHQIASSVLETVSAYWECIGATQILRILRASEREADDMEAVVIRLAKSDLFSLAYVEQAQSNSREKRTRRVTAELDEYRARQALGVSMGLDGMALSAPPLPAESFPELTDPGVPGPAEYARVIRSAQDRRDDLHAAESSREALAILSRAARRDLRPRVDLSLQLSYDGVDDGQRPQAFLSNEHDGLRVMGGLSMEFPVEKRLYSGQLRQALAGEEQAQVLLEQLSQTIASDVMIAVTEVANSHAAFQVSLEAEKYYAQALDKQRKRFLIGDSSFIDVIALQDGYRDAQLETIAARRAHLVALATLRFASGSLVHGTDASGTVEIDKLTTIPEF